MQTQQSKELPSSLFPKTIVKNEETISICAVKQEDDSAKETCHFASPTFGTKRSLIDSHHGVTTPDIKRMKQERDELSFCEHEESNSLSIKTSLQSIVNEVAHSFEEDIPSLRKNDNPFFESANRPLSPQADRVGFERQERQPNSSPYNAIHEHEVRTGHENLEASTTFSDNHKDETVSGLSSVPFVNQVHDETSKPILRTITALDSGKSEGFAYDHNFFPKLVGIHSISTPTSSSPNVESHHDFQPTTSSPPALENKYEIQNIDSCNVEETPDVYEVDPSASSPTNRINFPVQSPTSFQSEKQYDLLLTFNQDDGTNDMFLVIKDKVFAVKRFEHKGESYLIHTDKNGKSSILAKAPKEEQTKSQDCGSRTSPATAQKVLSNQSRSSIASMQSSHRSRQRNNSQNSTPPQISSTAVQNIFSQTFAASTTKAASAVPAVPSGQHPTAYSDTRMPRRQSLNQKNSLRAVLSEHRQRPQVPAGQQRFPSQARADRHHVVANANSLQNPIPINQAHRVVNTSPNIMSNRQFIVNQGLVNVNQPRNDATIVPSRQQYANTTTQIPNIGNNTAVSSRPGYVSNSETADASGNMRRSMSRPSATDESRIEQRKMLMNYITKQLVSRQKRNSSTRNSPELINLVSNGREDGRQTINNENSGRTESPKRGQVMAGSVHQLQNFNVSLTPRNAKLNSAKSRSIPSAGNKLAIHDAGQRYHPNQTVVQNGSVVHPQPRFDATHHTSQPRTDATQLIADALQGGAQLNEKAECTDKISQIIESWKRHQQTKSSKNTQFQQIRELLTRVDGSTNPTQNTHSPAREETATRHSQVAQPSTLQGTTPVISQVSYGVISRSTDGENVSPKRTATALVIDPQHSIYVDATDSVIDKEHRTINAGQQFSHIRNTRPHPSQSGNVAVSFPVPSGQRVGVPLNSAPVSPRYAGLVPAPLTQQLLHSYNLQSPKTAPKVDKRCVANNTLNPVNIPPNLIRTNEPPEIRFVPVFLSGLQAGTSEVQVRGNYNIGIPCQVTKPGEVNKPSEVTRPGEAAKSTEVFKPCEVVKPCYLDKTRKDDVIEIIDSPPPQDPILESYLSIENDDQRSNLNEGPSKSIPEVAKPYIADKSTIGDVVEIENSALKRNLVDHESENKDSLNLHSEEDEQTRNNALRAELQKKIQATDERIAQEKIEWKKNRLNRLKIVLTKKLVKLPCAIDVTVIDDD